VDSPFLRREGQSSRFVPSVGRSEVLPEAQSSGNGDRNLHQVQRLSGCPEAHLEAVIGFQW